MKKTLLALTLLAFTGSAAFASDGDGKKGKKAKKEACTTEAKAASGCKDMGASAAAMPAGCCAKKAAKTTAATDTNVPSPVKSL